MLRLLLVLLPVSVFGQILGFKDSVEVHRTDVIYFKFGSDLLTETATNAVLDLARDRPGDLELYVEGHTDAVGSNRTNADLARRRSEAAVVAATAAGWPDSTIEIRHFGEERLAVRTQAKEERNRRVVLRSGLPRRYAVVRGRILDENDEPLAGGAVATSRYLADTVRTDDQGFFTVALPVDVGIILDLYAPGHFFESKTFVVREDGPAPNLLARLQRAEAGRTLKVENLYFVGNKTELLRESVGVPAKIVEFLRWNPELRVELAGHVNQPGERKEAGTWSYNLAMSRAKTIRDYVVGAGISGERVKFRGYSNWEMVNPRPRTEAQMRDNRRVEVRILDAGAAAGANQSVEAGEGTRAAKDGTRR